MIRLSEPLTLEPHGDATVMVRPMGIDTYQESVLYMRADCPICRSEGFESQSRVRVHGNGRAGLSDVGWQLLASDSPCPVTLAPNIVLSKTRHGDRDVTIDVPPLDAWQDHTPVLVDDIISTARTMTQTITHLTRAGYAAPVCIGVHAVFAGDAYQALQVAGAADIITTNSVPHPSNAIDLTALLVEQLQDLFAVNAGANGARERQP